MSLVRIQSPRPEPEDKATVEQNNAGSHLQAGQDGDAVRPREDRSLGAGIRAGEDLDARHQLPLDAVVKPGEKLSAEIS